MQISPEKLQLVMAKKCIGVNALAKKAGVSQPTVSRYRNYVAPNQSLRVIGLLAKALEVDPSEITD